MQAPFEIKLSLADNNSHIVVKDCRFSVDPFTDEVQDVVFGSVEIHRCLFHVLFVKVEIREQIERGVNDIEFSTYVMYPTKDIDDIYGEIQNADPHCDGNYYTIKDPHKSMSGDWIMMMHPFRN